VAISAEENTESMKHILWRNDRRRLVLLCDFCRIPECNHDSRRAARRIPSIGAIKNLAYRSLVWLVGRRPKRTGTHGNCMDCSGIAEALGLRQLEWADERVLDSPYWVVKTPRPPSGGGFVQFPSLEAARKEIRRYRDADAQKAAQMWSARTLASRLKICVRLENDQFLPIEDSEASREVMRKFLATLTPRWEKILKMRFGIDHEVGCSLLEIAKHFGLEPAEIERIEVNALRKLSQTNRYLARGLDEHSMSINRPERPVVTENSICMTERMESGTFAAHG